ncbi:MAG TPA: hypothetical protein DIW77_03675 [Chromatiaceae bacterium]|nr:MAG: hypothetical protein N838_26565 [Thiohalocapsa sp. PB-PSB1]HCS89173.1 hypothetical protein [Chromatiaceae bacterium]
MSGAVQACALWGAGDFRGGAAWRKWGCTVFFERRPLPGNALIPIRKGSKLDSGCWRGFQSGAGSGASSQAGGGERQWLGGLPDMSKDALHWDGLGEEGDDAHVRTAVRTDQR